MGEVGRRRTVAARPLPGILRLCLGLSGACAVAGPASAQGSVQLSDLHGHSIVAEHWYTESNTIFEEDGSRHENRGARFKFKNVIYIGTSGRLFHRAQFFDLNPGFERAFPQFDNIYTTGSEALEFSEKSGFVFKKLPGASGRNPTFLIIVTISVARSGDGFSCHVERRIVPKQGETKLVEYIDMDRPKRYKVLYSQKQYDEKCTVTAGNVYAE